MLASVIASAQELTETATFGAITVQHPANFIAEQVTDGGLGLIDDTDSFAILIFTADALAEMGLPEAATSADFINTMTEIDAVTGEPSPISLAGAEGFVVVFRNDGQPFPGGERTTILKLRRDAPLLVRR